MTCIFLDQEISIRFATRENCLNRARSQSHAGQRPPSREKSTQLVSRGERLIVCAKEKME